MSVAQEKSQILIQEIQKAVNDQVCHLSKRNKLLKNRPSLSNKKINKLKLKSKKEHIFISKVSQNLSVKMDVIFINMVSNNGLKEIK
jgi:hypothetical protein